MHLPDLYRQQAPAVSFEFFPPKSPEAEEALFRDTVPGLKRLGPAYISVTYGAGGGTRGTSLRVVDRLRGDFGIEAVAHVTCVGSTREMVASVLDEAWSKGVRTILALRGDPPRGETTFQPVAGGFRYARDLIEFVRGRHPFAIGAACYPEGHVECPSKQLDWDRTVEKVRAGADFLITQLFYDARYFLEMEAYLRGKGVAVPIIPGILPFLGAEQIKRFTTLCGAQLGPDLKRRIEELAHDDESVRRLGVEVCTGLCRQLLDHGVPGIHVYCLNRLPSAAELLANLGLVRG